MGIGVVVGVVVVVVVETGPVVAGKVPCLYAGTSYGPGK